MKARDERERAAMTNRQIRRASQGASAAVIESTSGYRVAAQKVDGSDLVTVTAPDGQLCVSIRLSPDGPMVEVRSPSIRLVSSSELRLDCETLTVNARREAVLRTGKLQQIVDGDALLLVEGALEHEAREQRLRARLGDLQLTANDDVCLDGERVLLNSPKPAEPAFMPAPPPVRSLPPAPASPAKGRSRRRPLRGS
jgi:hypothetical protein